MRIMPKSPFPEYVYCVDGTLITKTKNDSTPFLDINFSFTDQELKTIHKYLKAFDNTLIPIGLKQKLGKFAELVGSDIFSNLPHKDRVIEFVYHRPNDEIKKILSFTGVTGFALEYAIKVDDVELFLYCVQLCSAPVCDRWQHIANFAIEHGSVSIIKWIREIGPPNAFRRSLIPAAIGERYDMIKWIYDSAPPCRELDKYLVKSLEMIKWLDSKNYQLWSSKTIDYAAQAGNLEVIEWLHEHRPLSCTKSAMDEAARLGHFHVVEWLHSNRSEGCTKRAMDWAIMNGHMELAEWLHSNRSEGCSKGALTLALKRKNAQVIKWLVSKTYFTIDVVVAIALEKQVKLNIGYKNGVLYVEIE